MPEKSGCKDTKLIVFLRPDFSGRNNSFLDSLLMRKIFVIITLCVLSCSALFAQQDCGAVDCPGRCGRFVDQNNDGFCDHGRVSAPVESTPQNTPSETQKSVDKPSVASANDASQTGKVAHKTTTTTPAAEPAQGVEPEQQVAPAAETEQTDTVEQPTEEVPAAPVKNKSPYSLILISSITIGLYLLTFFLVKVDKLKKATHRKIWNVLLLITALVSCLLGFFLVIQINYNLKMDWLWTVKLYHVQFGIAMTIIAVIHILWHVNYWKSVVKRGK